MLHAIEKKKSSSLRSVPSRSSTDPGRNELGIGPEPTVVAASDMLFRLATEESMLLASGVGQESSVVSPTSDKVESDGKKRVITNEVSTKKLIVTFENNDPEFDEDSDPDGDLDF